MTRLRNPAADVQSGELCPPGRNKTVWLDDTIMYCRAQGGLEGFDLCVLAEDGEHVRVLHLQHSSAFKLARWLITWLVLDCWLGLRGWLWARQHRRRVSALLRNHVVAPAENDTAPAELPPSPPVLVRDPTPMWRAKGLRRRV